MFFGKGSEIWSVNHWHPVHGKVPGYPITGLITLVCQPKDVLPEPYPLHELRFSQGNVSSSSLTEEGVTSCVPNFVNLVGFKFTTEPVNDGTRWNSSCVEKIRGRRNSRFSSIIRMTDYNTPFPWLRCIQFVNRVTVNRPWVVLSDINTRERERGEGYRGWS